MAWVKVTITYYIPEDARMSYVTKARTSHWCPDPLSPGTQYSLTAGRNKSTTTSNEISSFLLSVTTFPPRFPSAHKDRIHNVNDTEDSPKASSFFSCRRIFGDSWSLSSSDQQPPTSSKRVGAKKSDSRSTRNRSSSFR